eukprot:6645532-Prymnesium_polylepis.2
MSADFMRSARSPGSTTSTSAIGMSRNDLSRCHTGGVSRCFFSGWPVGTRRAQGGREEGASRVEAASADAARGRG